MAEWWLTVTVALTLKRSQQILSLCGLAGETHQQGYIVLIGVQTVLQAYIPTGCYSRQTHF